MGRGATEGEEDSKEEEELMPLPKGYGVRNFEETIRKLHRENARKPARSRRSNRQILAIAYANARRWAEIEGARPAWLRKRQSKVRRTR